MLFGFYSWRFTKPGSRSLMEMYHRKKKKKNNLYLHLTFWHIEKFPRHFHFQQHVQHVRNNHFYSPTWRVRGEGGWSDAPLQSDLMETFPPMKALSFHCILAAWLASFSRPVGAALQGSPFPAVGCFPCVSLSNKLADCQNWWRLMTLYRPHILYQNVIGVSLESF